jgi:hypothetical protein
MCTIRLRLVVDVFSVTFTAEGQSFCEQPPLACIVHVVRHTLEAEHYFPGMMCSFFHTAHPSSFIYTRKSISTQWTQSMHMQRLLLVTAAPTGQSTNSQQPEAITVHVQNAAQAADMMCCSRNLGAHRCTNRNPDIVGHTAGTLPADFAARSLPS